MGLGKLGTLVLCLVLFASHPNISYGALESCGKTIAEADEEKALMVFAAHAATTAWPAVVKPSPSWEIEFWLKKSWVL